MIKKVIRPGLVRIGNVLCSVFCKIEYADGKLSISGVEGPKSNGDASGSCGQIDMGYKHGNPDYDDKRYSHPKEIESFADGWTNSMWLKFLDIWHDWHLNDMRSYCSHQRDLGWRMLASKEVNLYHWNLKQEVSSDQYRLKKHAIDCAKRDVKPVLSDEQRLIICLECSIQTHTEKVDEPIAKYYEPKIPLYQSDKGHIEKKTLGWLYPKDHPDGILTKPCPSCGHKYGSAWLKEQVPTDVLDFLAKLPDADKQPAWV